MKPGWLIFTIVVMVLNAIAAFGWQEEHRRRVELDQTLRQIEAAPADRRSPCQKNTP